MKKMMCIFLAVLMLLGLAACGSEKQESTTAEGFQPALDTSRDLLLLKQLLREIYAERT